MLSDIKQSLMQYFLCNTIIISDVVEFIQQKNIRPLRNDIKKTQRINFNLIFHMRQDH